MENEVGVDGLLVQHINPVNLSDLMGIVVILEEYVQDLICSDGFGDAKKAIKLYEKVFGHDFLVEAAERTASFAVEEYLKMGVLT